MPALGEHATPSPLAVTAVGGDGGNLASGDDASTERPSLDELRARLDDLEVQIRAREDEEADRLAAR